MEIDIAQLASNIDRKLLKYFDINSNDDFMRSLPKRDLLEMVFERENTQTSGFLIR